MFSLKENLDFLGKMLMVVQEKFMSLVVFVVIVSRIGWVCVRVLFYKKIYGFGWKENVMMHQLFYVNFFSVWFERNFLGKMLNA